MVKLAERWVQQSGIRYNFLQTSVFTKEGKGRNKNTRFCVLLFYYHKLLFVFMTAKFLLSLTKLSQIKRARPSTASIT